MPYFHLSFSHTRKIIYHTVFLFNFTLWRRKKHVSSLDGPKNSPWSEPVIISSPPTKYNTRHKSLKQRPFVLNFLRISFIHSWHLCSQLNVPLSFPNVEPRIFWSTEMTAIPNQHWGGENHTSVSRFVTSIVEPLYGYLQTSFSLRIYHQIISFSKKSLHAKITFQASLSNHNDNNEMMKKKKHLQQINDITCQDFM